MELVGFAIVVTVIAFFGLGFYLVNREIKREN